MVLRTVSDDNRNLNEFGNLGTRTNVTVYFFDGTIRKKTSFEY